jgi:hypothetical protein
MRQLRDSLEDLNTQRILFDSHQAATFASLNEPPPDGVMAKVHPPFKDFYLEFTEPVMVGESEPGQEDFMRAILWQSNVLVNDTLKLSQVTVLMTSYTETWYIDRTFKVDSQSGLAYVTPNGARTSPDPSELPRGLDESQGSYFASGSLLRPSLDLRPHRYVGWWERATRDYASFLSWVLTYMMAKGISIVEQRLSKKERKRLEARKIPVQPWHVIVVEPQFSQSNGVGMREGRKHSYRYDVMGHLRFGNHHVKDSEGNWTRRRTVEWIAPHQRGVQHSRYVPAVRQYKRGKATHPAFREYMEGGR